MTPTVTPASSPRGGQVLAAALHAAGRGWPVFPVGAGKQPWIRAAHPPGHPCAGECGTDGHGWRDATTDVDRIRAWWTRWPRIPAYGIATGPAGLVVIDLDRGKGDPPTVVLPDQGEHEPVPPGITDGAEVLAWAIHRDGADLAAVTDTLTVTTPSGGRHLYYTAHHPASGLVVRSSVGYSAGRVTGIGWCIDVRAAGGYVLGPGSRIRTRHGWGLYRALPGPCDPRPLHPFLQARLAANNASAHTHSPETPDAARIPSAVSAPGVHGAGAGHAPSRGADRAGLPPAGSGSRFFAAAVAGELAHIAAAIPGDQGGAGRNNTVNRAAYKLGQLIGPLHLAETDIDALAARLLAAARATGLTEREARTAIASGLAQGQANPRTLAPPATARASTARQGTGRPPGRADPLPGHPRVRCPVPSKGREGRS
jgi:hypothetical protein